MLFLWLLMLALESFPDFGIFLMQDWLLIKSSCLGAFISPTYIFALDGYPFPICNRHLTSSTYVHSSRLSRSSLLFGTSLLLNSFILQSSLIFHIPAFVVGLAEIVIISRGRVPGQHSLSNQGISCNENTVSHMSQLYKNNIQPIFKWTKNRNHTIQILFCLVSLMNRAHRTWFMGLEVSKHTSSVLKYCEEPFLSIFGIFLFPAPAIFAYID